MTEDYPRDEFDDVVLPPGGRRGAHRARPSRARVVVPTGLVAVTVAATVVSAAAVLGGPSADDAAVASGSPTAVAAGDALTGDALAGEDAAGGALTADPALAQAPADVVTEEAPAPAGAIAPAAEADEEADEEGEEEAGEDAEAEAEVAEEPDTSVPVVVLNGTRTQGLAARAAAGLEDEGWTVASTGNDRTGDGETTTVAYPEPELEVTAAAIAEHLGADAQLEPTAADDTVTVVLGADWDG